ncbi:hypothetical protein N7481_009063 [Penicillium waksmanii]|uniref:uncharacterized protein n=1 Tax=Penicillium waksmanii TaxID=69791 RepID=UPI0025476828|nr:uncharacterized protein N7481_009063 [Penicillium waksmanii]KAJ5975356.1 hypothetical protein N7481_009063 [Penicillium waksmanii]
MASLNLPNELLVAIAENLQSMKEINAFARTNRHCHTHLNRHLYRSSISRTDNYGLHWATERGLSRTVEIFIEVGAIDGPDAARTIEVPLNIAAFRGHVKIVTLLIEYGEKACGDMNLNVYCQNALSEAIKGDQIAVVDVLLRKDRANPEIPFADGQNAIHLAARCDNGPMIRLLHDRGVDLYSLYQCNTSALQIAAIEGNLIAVDVLLECGFNPNFIDGNGDAPIHGLGKASRGALSNENGIFSRLGYEKTLTRTLLDYGADPYLKNRYGFMPLWIASYLGLGREVQTLLDYGVNPDGLDRNVNAQKPISLQEFVRMEKESLSGFGHGGSEDHLDHSLQVGTTPLCIAACMGRFDPVLLLLKNGANPNVRNPNGDTPLHLAVLNKKAGLVSLLIEKGAYIDAKNGSDQSPLRLALESGDIRVMEVLFEAGASINCIESTNLNPIFRALDYGHSDFGRTALLPPGIVDTGNDSTFVYQNSWPHRMPYWRDPDAEEEGCERVVEWFLKRGTDVNTQDPLGRTMLHQATFQNCTESVKLLLKRGANPMAKDSFGQIPLHMACSFEWYNSKQDIFKILLEAGSDPNTKDENGDTPLHMAARSSFSVGLRILRRDDRADFMAKNNRGNLPLHEGIGMVITCDDSLVELRRAYTDCNLVNSDGKTIWDLIWQDLDFDDTVYFTDAFSRVLLEDEESESESGS